MPTPHPPRPLDPPPGGDPGESDDSLAGRLRGHPESEAAHAVALLTARHWRPAHDYAAVCLATASETAAMVTAAAFRRVLDRLAEGEPAAALRPRLLVAVRDTVRQWAADERITGALPQLLRPAGGRGMRAAGSLIPDNRALAARAFAALPGPARCLLWHTEVEAEPLHVPAELLGLDPETAAATLAQARETFREGCVHAHLHLAPGGDCRFYNRLLDVQIRRGGPLLPMSRTTWRTAGTAGTRPSSSATSAAGSAPCSPRPCSAGAPAATSTPGPAAPPAPAPPGTGAGAPACWPASRSPPGVPPAGRARPARCSAGSAPPRRACW
ncbi:hypothetical protein SFUMM280S_10770 [Streptomyces fumanus]